MRIPFPERIPLNRVGIFVSALFVIQMLEGTDLYFSVGCVAFVMIAAFAFNIAGGLTRASGAYIFSYSVLVVLIGICYKAFLGEPAQSNLQSPQRDIELYIGSITAMFAAALVSRRFSRKTGLLQNLLPEFRMYRSSVGCIAFGVSGVFVIALLGQSGAKLQSAFGQLNQLIPLGIIIGIMYEIRRSGGRRSTNLIIILAAIYYFFLGLTGFSKQGMLQPLLCWILPVCALRFRLSGWQIISCTLAIFVMFHYLVPFSQYGRSLVPLNATVSQRLDIAIPLLEHPEETRKKYTEQALNEEETIRGLGAYYNKPQGFWERLQFVSVDDALINFTDQGHVFGLLPIKMEFLNAIPHVFWPDKPQINFGNAYLHEMGGLAPEDTETGIAFSPTGEAYHLARWTGVLIIAPLLWCLFFIVFDSLFGDLRTTAWGLLALAIISHLAPEGGVTSLIYLITFGAVILTFCAFFAAWVAPILAIPIIGPDRQRSQPRIPSQLSPTPQSPL